MREIKFRFFDTTSKKMYGMKDIQEYDLEQLHRFSSTDDPYTKVIQYTGLKDKNGVEIYDGDILKADGARDEHGATVKWFESGWNLGGFHRLTESNIQSYKMVIIGNIHENPELLEK